MFNFLSKVLKNKKVFACVFLFLAIGGIIVPQVSYAASWWCAVAAAAGPGVSLWGCSAVTAISSAAKAVAEKGAENVSNSILNDLIYAVGYIITTITSGLMGLAAGTLKWILDYQNAFTITRDNNVVTVGWNSVKDLANMFIVLGFVVIGIAFTLRLEGYGSKKTLINLIMIALLINFSLVICGIFIDGANKAVDFFLQGSNVLPETFIEGITKQLDVLGGAFSKDDPVNTLGIATQFAFYNIVAFIVFLLFAFLFLFRLVALMILVILAPLAFVSYVFPFTKNIAQMWWSNFFQWCIIGIPGSFFLYLADLLTKQANITEVSDPMLFLLPGFFLIVGFLFSLKMAPMGASAVTGFARGTVSFATGAIAGGATGAAGLTGLRGLAERGGQKIKDTATSAGEKLRLVAPGTTVAAKANRLSEPTKRLGNITDNAELAKIAERTPITSQQSQDRAAAAQILAERNALGTIDPKKRDTVMAHAVSMGVSKDKFTKGSAEAFTESTDKEATRSWRDKEVKSLMDTGMSGVDAYNIVKSQNPTVDQLKQAKIDLRKQKIIDNALGVSPISDREVTNRLVEDQIKTEMDAGKTYQEAQKSVATYKPNETEISVKRGAMAKEKIEKAVAKLSPKKITELPSEAFSVDVSINLTAKQLTEISKNAPPAVVEKIKSTIPEMRKEIESTLGLAHGATDASIRAAVASASRDNAEKVRGIARKMKLINRL
jgi:hypothetical protein